VSSFGMVFYHPISSLVFKFSASLDHFMWKINVYDSFHIWNCLS
jgi:hypothetical protein